jgi:hypothetical protein
LGAQCFIPIQNVEHKVGPTPGIGGTVGQWKRFLNKCDAEYVWKRAGDLMKKLGYKQWK